MNKLSYITILFLFVGLAIFNACNKTEDYSHIVYKNYLTYEINRAENFVETTAEGTREGEYQTGSKQAYLDVIDQAKHVDENPNADQEEIDQAYSGLLQGSEDFFDQMVPFRSAFQVWIDYSEILLGSTEEGTQEGNVKSGSKAVLQEATDKAKDIKASEDLTQRALDQATTDLTGAIYLFNSEIIGKATTAMTNPGFELPGFETVDFNEVEGWNAFGKVEDWAPKASVSPSESAPEGAYFARIGSYTQGIYQNLPELINPNADYTLNFKVSLQTNEPDWQGKKFPAILRTRILVFEQKEGDYNFVTVLSESIDTLGIKPGDFIELNHTVSIDAISASIGKKVAVDFLQRHTWDAANPIWAESFVALDDIHLFRKL
ncbi:MAG: hypothetical protein R6W31_18455 [Bacteroidales bacterium]